MSRQRQKSQMTDEHYPGRNILNRERSPDRSKSTNPDNDCTLPREVSTPTSRLADELIRRVNRLLKKATH